MADIAPSSIVLRGCLKKKSPKGISGLRAWQKRHFFLFDDQLAYAKQDDVGKIQGTIPLSEVTCIEQIQGKPTRIRIEVATRRFDLDAATSDECDNWIAALQRSWISTKEKLAGAPVLSPHSSSSIANPRSPLMTGKFWKASTSGNMPSGGSSGNDNLSAPSITATVLNSKAFTPIKVPSLLTESGYFGTVSRRSATSPPSPIKSRGSHVSAETLFQDNDSNPPSHYDLQSHHSDYATTTTTSTTPKVSNLIRNAMKRSQSINNSLFSGNDSSKEPDGADIGFADFERGDKIADCGIGSLNRAILRDTNESYLLQVAMKRDEHYDKGVMLIKLMNRVELRHPFFSQLAFSGSTPDRAWAAYKFVAPSATLFERLRSVKRLPEDQACNYLSQVLLFTAFLHQSGRLFRNMKPEFIGLDAINDEIMVLDLEGVAFSSVRASETEELPDGDVFDEFWTPELIAGQGESLISDWWRLGSLLYELLVGFPPFRAKSREELLAKTRDGSVRFPPFISSAAQDFIRRCLIHDPNHRLGADIRDLFSHRLFQDVNWAGAHWKVISRSVPDVDPDPPVRVKVKVKDLSEFPGSGSSLEPIIRLTYGDQTWTSQPNTSYSSTPSWNSNCQFYHDTYAAAANSLLKVEVCAGQVPLAFAFEAVDLLVRGSQKKRVQLSNIDGTLLGVLTLEIKVKDTDVNQDQDTSPEHSLRMLKRSMTSSSSMKGGGKAGRPGLNVSRPHRRASLLQDMSDKLSGKLRSLVSKNKLRFQVDGFDLDLTYLTSQMIVMGFPSSNLEGVYRNPIEEVQRFVKTYHNGHCRVINLCSERSYDPACFDSNCASFPFDDHTPPPIKLIVDFCRDGKAYLDGHPDNVIAIHCKAGKGRSGVMASSFLLYLGLKPTAATALDFFGDQRTADGKGVTIPSQIRAVHTFEKYLRQTANDTKPFPFNSHYQNILLIRMSPEPDLSPLGGCDPFCRIYRNRSLIFDSLIGKVTVTRPAKDIVDIPVDCVVNGDIKIAVYHKTATGKKLMFSFWINIDFIENNHVVLDKAGLDKADKNNKFDPSFHVELFTKSAEHAKIESLEAANQGSDEEATEDDSQHSNATARPSRGATTSASIDTINSDKFPKMRKRSPHAISGSLPDLHEYPTNDEDDDLSKVSVTSSQSNSAEPFFNTPIDIDPSPMSDVIEEHDGNSAAESPSSSTIGFAAGKGVSRRQSRQQQTDLAEIDEGNNQDEDDDDNDDDDDADDDDDDHQAEPKTAVE